MTSADGFTILTSSLETGGEEEEEEEEEERLHSFISSVLVVLINLRLPMTKIGAPEDSDSMLTHKLQSQDLSSQTVRRAHCTAWKTRGVHARLTAAEEDRLADPFFCCRLHWPFFACLENSTQIGFLEELM